MKLNAKELRDLEEKKVLGEIREVKRNPIYFILENIYDTYNIGGLFRLADALAIEKIYLCGDTEIPPNSRIKKASIGTYKVVPWEYSQSSSKVIKELRISNFQFPQINSFGIFRGKPISKQIPNSKFKTQNEEKRLQVMAVEQHKTAIDYRKADYSLPIALLFGNETRGVLPETLKLVDQIVEIPMWGINKSLNVIVSAAIVSYFVAAKL